MKPESQYRTEKFLGTRDVPATHLLPSGVPQDATDTADLCWGLIGSIAGGDRTHAPSITLTLAEQHPDGLIPAALTATGNAHPQNTPPDEQVHAHLAFGLLCITAATLPPFAAPRWDYFQYDDGSLYGPVAPNATRSTALTVAGYAETLTDPNGLVTATNVTTLRESALAGLLMGLVGFHTQNPALIGKAHRSYHAALRTFLRGDVHASALHDGHASLTPDTEGLSLLGLLSVLLDHTPGENQIRQALQRCQTLTQHTTPAATHHTHGYQQGSRLADTRAAMLAARFTQLTGRSTLARTIQHQPHLRLRHHPEYASMLYRHNQSPHLSYASSLLDTALNGDLLILPPWVLRPLSPEAP